MISIELDDYLQTDIDIVARIDYEDGLDIDIELKERLGITVSIEGSI